MGRTVLGGCGVVGGVVGGGYWSCAAGLLDLEKLGAILDSTGANGEVIIYIYIYICRYCICVYCLKRVVSPFISMFLFLLYLSLFFFFFFFFFFFLIVRRKWCLWS